MKKNETVVTDEIMYSEEDGYLVGQFQRGYRDEEGNLHKTFVYRDMDGEDEEALGKPNVKNDAYKIAETMLTRCIMQIGNIDKKKVSAEEWKNVIKSLAIGDQDIAILRIREEAVGTEIRVSHTCPNCGKSLETVIDTSELRIVEYGGSDTIDFELPKGLRTKDGKLAKTGLIRIPDGRDRQMLSDMASKDISKANSLLLVRTIEKLDGVDVITNDTVTKMSIKDRKHLMDIIKDNSFGVDTGVDITCPNCGSTQHTQMQVLNFI